MLTDLPKVEAATKSPAATSGQACQCHQVEACHLPPPTKRHQAGRGHQCLPPTPAFPCLLPSTASRTNQSLEKYQKKDLRDALTTRFDCICAQPKQGKS